MNKGRRIFVIASMICLLFAGIKLETKAEEYKVPDVVTGMDTEGNIYVIEDAGKIDAGDDGLVNEASFYSLYDDVDTYSEVVDPWIVNFNTGSGGLTYYNEYITGYSGYTYGPSGADAVYLMEEGSGEDKVAVFMMSGVIGKVKVSDIKYDRLSNTKSISHYKVVNGKLIHYISSNIYSENYASALNQGPAPAYLESGVKYYSYDGHYFYTDYSVMQKDYYNSTRSNSINPNEPFYNYYQYLPFRSWSSYTGSDLNSVVNVRATGSSLMNNIGDIFIRNQNIYGVNALLSISIAANESAWGTSSIAQQKNNLFGLNAVDSSPGESADVFDSAAACVQDFAKNYISRGYMYPKDWRYFGGHLGNKASGVNVKYASDPYWGEKAANIAWMLDSELGGHDINRFSIGIKDTMSHEHDTINIRNYPSTTNSTVLYSTSNITNYPVIILGSTNGFYEIQSDAILSSNGNSITKSDGTYNYDFNHAFISSDYVTQVIKGTGAPTRPKTPDISEESNKPVKPDSSKDKWVLSNGYWYYYQDGVMLKYWQKIDGIWYYLGSDGRAVQGWQLIDGFWYYFDGSNHMLTGWQDIGGERYYLHSSGAAAKGWTLIDGFWYYFDGSNHMLTGWQDIGGERYYLGDDGKASKGWEKIDDYWYYFDGSNHMLTGWQKLGDYWYYLKSSGAAATGWEKVNGYWYYFDGSNHMLTGWQKLGDYWYYLKSSGAAAKGWEKVNGYWYYFDGSNHMLTGWQYINGNWFYLTSSGAAATGWQYINGYWYYFNSSCYMLTGWQWINGKCYYMYPSGAMASNTTIDGSYVNSSGAWVP